jgi:hypothetical protein
MATAGGNRHVSPLQYSLGFTLSRLKRGFEPGSLSVPMSDGSTRLYTPSAERSDPQGGVGLEQEIYARQKCAGDVSRRGHHAVRVFGR